MGVSLCPKTMRVAVAAENGAVAVWSIRDSEIALSHELEAARRRVLGVEWSPEGDGHLAISGFGVASIVPGAALATRWRVEECPPRRAGRHRPAWWRGCVAVACGREGAAWFCSKSGARLAPVHGRVVVRGDAAVSAGSTSWAVWSLDRGVPRVRCTLEHGGDVQRWALCPRGRTLWAVDFAGRVACWALPRGDPGWADRPGGRRACLNGGAARRLAVDMCLQRPSRHGLSVYPGLRVMKLWVQAGPAPGDIVVHASTANGHFTTCFAAEGGVVSRRRSPKPPGDWVEFAGPRPTDPALTSCGSLELGLLDPIGSCVPHDAFDAGEWGVALALVGGRGVQVWLPRGATESNWASRTYATVY